jgi:trehalose-6-phosphate synthase
VPLLPNDQAAPCITKCALDPNEDSAIWTSERLKQVFQSNLKSTQLLVVSNRQPYAHTRLHGGQVEVQMSTGGLVTALEPLVRACSGTWVAHGHGSADREFVDEHDRIRLPEEKPWYSLRRLWLSPAEEQGYFHGFANSALWPLCHNTPVSPEFRRNEWETYELVNAKFADAVLKESLSEDPLVLVQDYHLALVPGLLRVRMPRATITIFWHVPWPSLNKLELCPWWREIIVQMLGADIIGFNTVGYCKDFLAAVERIADNHVDHSKMTVVSNEHICRIVAYPESIEWSPRWMADIPPAARSRAEVRSQYNIGENVFLGLGIDRWDYTKGILERLLALEKMLECNPRCRGMITLLQIAAPSRSALPAYMALQRKTTEEVERINRKFATHAWKPIVFVGKQQKREQIFKLYRGVDFCLVNSLHDGMNLVAKEFVAARNDEDGVLILSAAAGASIELTSAILIDPLNIGDTSTAIEAALNMSRHERRDRMRRMRYTVERNNVYRWAGTMLMDAGRVSRSQ